MAEYYYYIFDIQTEEDCEEESICVQEHSLSGARLCLERNGFSSNLPLLTSFKADEAGDAQIDAWGYDVY